MSEERIPESVREYFGHDKVALQGDGGMPAAPPAPPGSTARKAGEAALADAMSKLGTPGPRPGDRPAALPPKPHLPRVMRGQGEIALMEAAQRRFAPRVGAPAPHPRAGWFWRSVFAPLYRAIPWGIKRHMVRMASGVRNWRS